MSATVTAYPTVDLVAHMGYGGDKPWIARIKGTSAKFGLEREFLASRLGKSKSGRTGNVKVIVTMPGLYECCNTDQKGKSSLFYVILPHDGGLVKVDASLESAHEIAAALDGGKPITDLGFRIKPDVKPGQMSWNAQPLTFRGEDGKLLWRVETPPPPAPTGPSAPTGATPGGPGEALNLSQVSDQDLLAEIRKRGL